MKLPPHYAYSRPCLFASKLCTLNSLIHHLCSFKKTRVPKEFFSIVEVTNSNRWQLEPNTHTLFIRKTERAECVCGVKSVYATNRKRASKRKLQVKGSHPLQLQVFLEKVESIKVSLYIVSLLLRLTSPLHAARV